jgi:hypothetical protein
MKIVTNGKKFRIQINSGKGPKKFAMRWWCSSPDGPYYQTYWETRFYGRAVKKMKRLEINAVRGKEHDIWVPV